MEKIDLKLNRIFSELKESDESGSINTSLIAVLAVYFISLVWFFIKFGFSGYIILYFLLFLAAAFYFRFTMMSPTKKLESNKEFESYKNVDQAMYLRSKCQYLLDGVNVKISRIDAVKTIFVVIIPFLLMIFREILLSPIIGVGSLVQNWLFAFLIGGLFWLFYFNGSKGELFDLEEDLEDIMEKI